MKVSVRELLMRGFGLLAGSLFVIETAHDLRASTYNSHGTIIHRADQPITFWTLIAFQVFCAIIGFIFAVIGTGRNSRG